MAETKRKTASRATKKTAPKKTAPKRNTKKMDEEIKTQEVSTAPSSFKIEVLSKKTKITLLVVIGLILLGILLYINRGLFIAATVNGQPIPRLSVVSALESQYGADMLNRLIDKQLILQKAQEENVAVSQEELDKRYKELVDQISGGDENNFNQVLTSQGLTKEEFYDELRIQILAEKLLGNKVEVTDQEFDDFLTKNPDLLEDAQNPDEVKKTYREQLKQQKLQSEYQKWITSLRNEAQVDRFVSY